MSNWYNDNDLQGNFLSCKEGEKLRVRVKEIRKIVGGYSKFHYKFKDHTPLKTKDTDEPFHHELENIDGKILTIGAISLMRALKDAKIKGGEEIEINHPSRGKYEVRILSAEEELPTNTPF